MSPLPSPWRSAALAATLLAACHPTKVPFDRYAADLGETLQDAQDQQLLANVVRLRYGETPLFLRPGVVTAALTYTTEAEIAASTPALGLAPKVGGTFTSSPTMTFEPLQGEDFATQYYGALTMPELVVLLDAGWPADVLLRTVVASVGDARNDPEHAGPLPDDAVRCSGADAADPFFAAAAAAADPYVRFLYVTCAFRAAQRAGTLRIVPVGHADEPAVVFPEPLGAAWALPWLEKGYRLEARPDGTTAAYPPAEDRYAVAFGVHQPGAAEAAHKALGAPGGRGGAVTIAVLGAAFPVRLRSFHEMLSHVARQIDVPGAPDAPGHAAPTLRVATERPDDVYVAVRHRGRSFYVDAADVQSKRTFALLASVLQMKAGVVRSPSPVLTLPVGR